VSAVIECVSEYPYVPAKARRARSRKIRFTQRALCKKLKQELRRIMGPKRVAHLVVRAFDGYDRDMDAVDFGNMLYGARRYVEE
jgi:hypothetical protein